VNGRFDEVLRELNSVCDTIIAFVREPGLKRWRWRATFPSPLEGEGGLARSAKTDEGCWKK
jgi:hypothetical protein